MSAQSTIDAAMAQVPNAIAAAVIDLSSSMVMAIRTTSSHPTRIQDLVGAATRDLFMGEMAQIFDTLFRQARGTPGSESLFKEHMMASPAMWHYFGRLTSNSQFVLAVVSRREVDLNAMVSKARIVAQQATI